MHHNYDHVVPSRSLRAESAEDFPDLLTLGFVEEMKELRFWLGVIHLPEFDWDAMLSQLFYALIQEEAVVHNTLRTFANDAAYNDLVFEHAILDADQKGRIYSGLMRAGLRIKEKLAMLGAYHDGVFPYTLRAAFDDGCLLFSKIEQLPCPAVSYPGY